MLMLVTQRLTASALAVGMVLMALSACAGGAMTMSEMVCCVDHHGECPMADMGKSCCGSERRWRRCLSVEMVSGRKPSRITASATLKSKDPMP